jgi:oligoribonuclease NrnB/cAMP/cGMP phosphodiesterase (DHH superfamily)
MNNESFKVRAYGFCELAQLYFPQISKQSATIQLRRWLRNNCRLLNELEKKCSEIKILDHHISNNTQILKDSLIDEIKQDS